MGWRHTRTNWGVCPPSISPAAAPRPPPLPQCGAQLPLPCNQLTCKSVPSAPLMPPTTWFRMSPGVVLLSLPPLVMAPSRPSGAEGWIGRVEGSSQ